MSQLFSDQLRQVKGLEGLIRLWLQTFTDLLRTVPVQHLDKLRRASCNRYGEAVRRSLFFARYEAEGWGSDSITPEHILLGVLRQDPGMRRFLNPPALDNIRHAIGMSLQGSIGAPGRGLSYHREAGGKEFLRTNVPLSNACKRILCLAAEEADKAGRGQIAPRDVVAGILRHGQTLAAELLTRHQIDLERLRSIK